MTKKKQLLILCGILAALLILYFLANAYAGHREAAQSEAAQELAVTALDKDRITSLSYTSGDDTCSFYLEEDTWMYAEDDSLSLQQDYVQALIDLASSITGLKKVESPDALSDYGLDDPAYIVVIQTDDGDGTEIRYGGMTVSGDYYVTADNGETIFTADSTLPELLTFDEDQLSQS